MRGLRPSISASRMRLKAIAAERAPTIARTIHSQLFCRKRSPASGFSRKASSAPVSANGSANTECSNLIISSVSTQPFPERHCFATILIHAVDPLLIWRFFWQAAVKPDHQGRTFYTTRGNASGRAGRSRPRARVRHRGGMRGHDVPHFDRARSRNAIRASRIPGHSTLLDVPDSDSPGHDLDGFEATPSSRSSRMPQPCKTPASQCPRLLAAYEVASYGLQRRAAGWRRSTGLSTVDRSVVREQEGIGGGLARAYALAHAPI